MNRSLVILCLIAAVDAGIALVRLDAAATQASAAQQELADCRQFLGDSTRCASAQQLGLLSATSGAPAAGGATNGVLESGIRQSVTASGLGDRLRTIVWTKPGDTGIDEVREVTGYLHFDNVTLEQLTRFLHHLAETDPTSRTQMIELVVPTGATGPGSDTPAAGETAIEVWSADVTLAYRLRAPVAKRPAK